MTNSRPARRTISLGFTEERVPEGQHICYLFNDEVERRRIMAKYLESGLADGEKILYLVDDLTPEEMLDALEDLGVDARASASRLTVTEAAPAYCPRGTFRPDNMLGELRDFYRRAVDTEGFSGARATGEMSWCLVHGRADTVSLLDYEARLTLLVAEHPCTACCQYDTRRFDGNTIMDVLAVHPMTILRGQLVRNPFFVEPGVFLQELHSRRGGAGR